MSYNLRFIHKALYRLKLRYGQPITFLTLISTTINAETGETSSSERAINVARAILLPNVWRRDFEYDLSYLAANKNFTYGAMFDVGQRVVLIDRDDLPASYVPSLNDRIRFDSRIFQIFRLHDYEHKQALLLILKELSNES